MRLRAISVCLIIVSIFLIGCSKETNSSNPSTSSSTENKKDEQNDIEKIREELSAASNYGESNPIERTMEESIEYTKSYLPKGAKEIKTSFYSDSGVTEVIYEYDGLYYSVTYMHPFKEGGNNVDEYDLEKTVGITLWVNESLDS